MKIALIRLICLPVLITMLCAGSMEEWDGLILEDIKVTGNVNENKRKISSFVDINRGEPVNSGLLRKNFKTMYQSGLFADIKFIMEKATKGAILEIIVEEFPKIGTIKISGNKKFNEEDLRNLLELKEGACFSSSLLNRSILKIREKYRTEGYLMTKVDPEQHENREKKTVNIEFIIDEGSEVLVEKIEFFGNDHIPARQIRRAMETKEDKIFASGKFNLEKFETDREKIINNFKKYGYINAAITDIKYEYRWNKPHRKTAQNVYISIWITEGEKYYFGDVKIKGTKLFEESEIRKWLKRKKGAVFNQEVHDNDIERIRSAYNERGYIFSRITPIQSVNEDDKTVHFIIDIYEGDKAHVESIIITGQEKTKEKVIRREIEVREGEIFNVSKIRRSVEKLMNLQYFESVIPEPRQGSTEGLMNLVFRVKEQRTGMLTAGGGWGTSSGPSIFTEVKEINFLGKGQTVSGKIEFAQKKQSIISAFTEPWILNLPVTAGINASANNEIFLFRTINTEESIDVNYTKFDFSIGLNLGYRFFDFWSVSAGSTTKRFFYYLTTKNRIGKFIREQRHWYITEEERQALLDPNKPSQYRPDLANERVRLSELEIVTGPIDPATGRSKWQTTESVNLSLSRDTRDNYLNTMRGSLASIYMEHIFISEKLTKWNFSLSRYFNPVWKVVLAFSSDLSFIGQDLRGRIENEEAHYYYFMQEELRGWDSTAVEKFRKSLCPNYAQFLMPSFDENYRPVGRAKIRHSAELRFPFAEKYVWGVFFADAGNLSVPALNFNNTGWMSDYRQYMFDFGAGIRIHIPMLPLRFYWSYRTFFDQEEQKLKIDPAHRKSAKV
ncbi:MAG TPA: outer membrane protein assembly factor BamA, partial [Spirochaetia bacterium]|nr:outer membrane protein assembly factor BamA [Spirochaetia bacterium]